jgi:hypothetical protein
MKFQVTFDDVFENCESEEQAYDALLDYLSEVVRFEDVTAFNFKKLSDEVIA